MKENHWIFYSKHNQIICVITWLIVLMFVVIAILGVNAMSYIPTLQAQYSGSVKPLNQLANYNGKADGAVLDLRELLTQNQRYAHANRGIIAAL